MPGIGPAVPRAVQAEAPPPAGTGVREQVLPVPHRHEAARFHLPATGGAVERVLTAAVKVAAH